MNSSCDMVRSKDPKDKQSMATSGSNEDQEEYIVQAVLGKKEDENGQVSDMNSYLIHYCY